MTLNRIFQGLGISLKSAPSPVVEQTASAVAMNASQTLIQLIENHVKAGKKDVASVNQLLALSLLARIVNASLPNPEKKEIEFFPEWKKEQIIVAWVVQCKKAGIEKPMELFGKSDAKKTDAIKWMEDFFGARLVQEMQKTEKNNPDYFENLIHMDHAKAVKMDIFREEAGKGSLHYMEMVMSATRAFLQEEKLAPEGRIVTQANVKNFVEQMQGFFNDPASSAGNLPRSLNEWPTDPVSERFKGLSTFFESDLNQILEGIDAFPENSEPEENNYMVRQLQEEISQSWRALFDRMFYMVMDEIFQPETGKIREDVLALLQLIQDRLPEGSPGKDYDLTNEQNQQTMAYGLAGAMFTNIVFVELMNASGHMMQTFEKNNDDEKIARFQTVNRATAKVLNGYNSLMEDARKYSSGSVLSTKQTENVGIFQAKVDEWRKVRGHQSSESSSSSTLDEEKSVSRRFE